jgi:hypothetical protein
MPCRSDYMQSTDREKELSRVYAFLDEVIVHKPLPKDFGTGYDARVYNRGLSQEHLDHQTESLCKVCQEIDVSKCSLELQMWWSKHQKSDAEHIYQDWIKAKTDQDRKDALKKLTPYERSILGI